ncbi:TspO/MBR family protein [Salinilacihabitans rarus]|uniref:TspO/MBR family protein n=1 Tax=Salinilacihabitans rarus TaxID=2961596 RepID=UPI0020C83F4C|nr:TspO/MBR family protein [Salinilacihabitans rarus]
MESSTQTNEPTGRLPDALTALAFVVAVNVVGAVPALIGGPDTAWFRALEKPAFYPPGWLFGVVWTVLFSLMGLALYLVVRRGLDRGPVRLAVGLFVLQMAFNVAWTPAFFALQAPLAALGVIAVLFVLVAATVAAFARVDRRAGALLVPYLAWVGFATVLNYAIWSLNA